MQSQSISDAADEKLRLCDLQVASWRDNGSHIVMKRDERCMPCVPHACKQQQPILGVFSEHCTFSVTRKGENFNVILLACSYPYRLLLPMRELGRFAL